MLDYGDVCIGVMKMGNKTIERISPIIGEYLETYKEMGYTCDSICKMVANNSCTIGTVEI